MRPASVLVLGVLVLLTAALAQPFLTAGAIDWSQQAGAYLLGTLALAAATAVHASLVGRLGTAVAFAAYACVLTWCVEAVGQTRGIWFGASWRYHEDLVPRLAGDVPLAIPLSWYVLAYGPIVLLRGVVPSDGSRQAAGRLLMKTALAATFLVGVDLLVDPLAVSANAWTWLGEGTWFGVPPSNFVGWWVTGVLLFLPVFALDGRRRPAGVPPAARADAVVLVGALLLLILAGYVSILRLGSVWPLLASLAAMAPACTVALRVFVTQRHQEG